MVLFKRKVISPIPEESLGTWITPNRYKVNFVAPTPTALPTPTAIPKMATRIEPISPQNIPQTYYTNRNAKIEPKLWDAIMESSPTGDIKQNDAMKRMALALNTQESSGGYNLVGDEGKSRGPYHIQRENVTTEQAMDPKYSTKLVMDEMLRNMNVNKVPLARSLRTWNWWSGYKNKGPRYNVDIPQMATTSSFYRGE